jgi:hypothetical protein
LVRQLCKARPDMLETKRMDETIGEGDGVSDPDEIEAEQYRYWQCRPMHERMAEVSRLSSAVYGLKHDGSDAPRLDKTLVRFERFPRPISETSG